MDFRFFEVGTDPHRAQKEEKPDGEGIEHDGKYRSCPRGKHDQGGIDHQIAGGAGQDGDGIDYVEFHLLTEEDISEIGEEAEG